MNKTQKLQFVQVESKRENGLYYQLFDLKGRSIGTAKMKDGLYRYFPAYLSDDCLSHDELEAIVGFLSHLNS